MSRASPPPPGGVPLCGTTANLAKLARSASVMFASSASCWAESCLMLSRPQPAGSRVCPGPGSYRVQALCPGPGSLSGFRVSRGGGQLDSYRVQFSLWNMFHQPCGLLSGWTAWWETRAVVCLTGVCPQWLLSSVSQSDDILYIWIYIYLFIWTHQQLHINLFSSRETRCGRVTWQHQYVAHAAVLMNTW